MEITKTGEGNKITLAISGSLDTMTSQKLQDELLPAVAEKGAEVELNFAALEYVSSAGLRVLLMGQQDAEENESTLTLTNVSDEIMEVFEMTGFDDVLTIIK